MTLRALRFAPALFFALACTSTSSSGVLFDGAESVEKAGWVASGDPTLTFALKTDAGNPALSVEGAGAPSVSFSLPIGPKSGGANSIGVTFRIRGSDLVRFSVSMASTIPVLCV